MKQLGKISFTDADAIDRSVTLNTERRHQFRVVRPEPEAPNPLGQVCPGCNLRRTDREFQGFGERHKTCATCRARAK